MDFTKLYIILISLMSELCRSMFLSGSESSHLRYPQLNFCQNSSISFDFKTTASPEALLVYTDEISRGKPDYLEISYDTSGHVTALVRDENRRKFRIGPYLLNDGRWHRVELRKVNSKIYLILDGIVTTAAYAYGESGTNDKHVGEEIKLPTTGDLRDESFVYVGGLPAEIREKPGLISLPSAALKKSLNGYIRNVIYRNCTCQTARVRHLWGSGFVDYPPSKCDDGLRRCPKGCTCVLADNENSFECDCSEKHCVDSIVTHYYIHFDMLPQQGDILLNQSDVTATMVPLPFHPHKYDPPTNQKITRVKQFEGFFIKHGVKNEALLLDEGTGHVRISGLDHYSECFGDLSLCHKGYTIMAWLLISTNCSTPNLDPYLSSSHRNVQPRPQEHKHSFPSELLIMSSGSLWLDGISGYGMLMTWDPRFSKLHVKVNTTSGLSGHVSTERMTSHSWHHVTFTWSEQISRTRLYLDGILVDEALVTNVGKQINQSEKKSLGDDVASFLIGRTWTNKTEGPKHCRGGFHIDEFNYWSEEKTEMEILEFGPLFCRTIPFDSLTSDSYPLPNFHGPIIYGNPTKVEGRIQGGVLFSGDEDSLEYRPIREAKTRSDPGLVTDGSTVQRGIGKTNMTMCFNNLELCQSGLTISVWIMIPSSPSSPSSFTIPGSGSTSIVTREILSTGCFMIWLKDGRLVARVMRETTHVEATTKEHMLENLWMFVEATWEGKQLFVYVNGRQVAHAKWWHVTIGDKIYPKDSVTFGRLEVSQAEADVQDLVKNALMMGRSVLKRTRTKRQANKKVLILDHAQLCYGNREALLRTGVINRGIPTNILLELDNVLEGGRLHSSNSNFLSTISRDAITVPGKVNNATRLDEKQFIEIKPLVRGLATSCLSDLSNCRHGFYLSSWVKFRDFTASKFVFFSNKNILVEYTKDLLDRSTSEPHIKSKRDIRAPKGTMEVNFTLPDMMWAGKVNGLRVDSWIFIEISWSHTSGLEIYVDRLLKSSVPQGKILVEESDLIVSESESLYFGRQGSVIRNSKLLLDETEIWFADRDTLIAFNYITRGNISQILVSFDFNATLPSKESQDPTTSSPGIYVVPLLFGDAEIIEDEGRTGAGLSLCATFNEGYAFLGSYSDTCLGNLEYCSHGLTITLLIKLRLPMKRGYLISTDGYFIELLDNGKVYVYLELEDHQWKAESSISLKVDKWYRLSMSWGKEKGLSLFVDKERRAYDAIGHKMAEDQKRIRPKDGERTYKMYIGRSSRDSDNEEKTCPNVKLNQVEFWYASRNMVLAFGSFEDDINGLRLNMQKIENDILVYRSHAAYVFGSPRLVSGFRGSGLLLNGLNQYVDLGRDVICKSYLENCVKGITVRFKVKPLELLNMTYFISSPLVDVYYNRGMFICEVRNRTKQWTLYTDHIALNSWNEVDITWREDKGAILLINNSKTDQDSKPTTNEHDHDPTKKFLIGRADTDMSFESYAHAIFDDVEFWEGDLETLKKFGHLKNDDYEDLPVRRRGGGGTRKTHGVHSSMTSSPQTGSKEGRGRQPIRHRAIGPAIFKPFHRKMLTFDGRSYVEFFVDLFPLDDLIQLQDWKSKMEESSYLFEGADLDRELQPLYHKKPENLTDPSEQLLVKFKTNDANGMLFYCGTADENVYLSIKSGFPLLIVNYNLNNSEKFRPTLGGQRLDDGQWHEILITRQHSRITINVDGIDHPRELSSGIGFMKRGKLLLGGEENVKKLTNYVMRNNFRGSIDKMTFINDSLPNGLNLIDVVFVKPTRPYLKIHGNVAGEPSADLTSRDPVVVTFQGSSPTFIKLPRWRVEIVTDDDDTGNAVKIHRPNLLAGVSPKHKPFIEFNFRTFEADCFLLYSGGKPGHTDFIALEISDGILWIVLDPGSGQLSRLVFGKEGENYISDGNPHFVKIELVDQTIKLVIDKSHRIYSIPYESSPFYHMGTFTYLGGVDNLQRLPWHVWNRERKEQFFVGCVWNIRFTGGSGTTLTKPEPNRKSTKSGTKEYYYDRDGDYESILNLPQLALEQGAETVLKGCKLRPSECLHQPCKKGRCRSVWNGFQCDCAGTDRTGPNCMQEAQRMAFAGENHIHLRFDSTHSRHRNGISVRFKTMETGGLLFKTRTKTSDDSIEAFIDEGRLWIGAKFGEQMPVFPMSCKCANNKVTFSDNVWHTLTIVRKAASLAVWVDDCVKNEAEIQGEGFAFDMEEITIGGLEWNNNNNNFDFTSYDKHYEYFVGYLQNFIFDGFRLLENLETTESIRHSNSSDIRPATLHPSWKAAADNSTAHHHMSPDDTGGTIHKGFAVVVNTAEAASDERLVPSRPITVKNAILEIPAAGGVPANISFLFRFALRNTSHLLFYRRGLKNESGMFLALEILRSKIRFSGNMGRGLREVKIQKKLRPREWHSLKLQQSTSLNQFFLFINYDHNTTYDQYNNLYDDDDYCTECDVDNNYNNDTDVSIDAGILTTNSEVYSLLFHKFHKNLQFENKFYLGGYNGTLEMSLEEGYLKTRDFFQGCLASLYFNGYPVNIQELAARTETSNMGYIEKRCSDEFRSHCKADTCKNGGRCLELRKGSACDCQLTSYIGTRCEKEAHGFHFGSTGSKGLFWIKMAEPTDDHNDVITMAMMTWQKNATLLRIESQSSSDYLETRLINGQLEVHGSLGGEELNATTNRGEEFDLGDLNLHSVLVKRRGNHLQLFVNNTLVGDHKGDDLKRNFKELAEVKVGGDVDHEGSIIGAFKGIIAGLYINGLSPIEMTIFNWPVHENITMETRGDVIVASHPFKVDHMEKHSEAIKDRTDLHPYHQQHQQQSHHHQQLPQVEGATEAIKIDETLDRGNGEEEVLLVNKSTERKRKEIPSYIGGGGVGWKSRRTETGMLDGISLVLMPGGLSGAGINTRIYTPTDDMLMDHQQQHPSYKSRRIIRNGIAIDNDIEGPRAIAVTGALIVTLLAASSFIWAFYQFKPGRLFKKRSKMDKFQGVIARGQSSFSRGRLANSSPYLGRSDSAGRTEIAVVDSNNKLVQTYLKGLCSDDIPLGSGFCHVPGSAPLFQSTSPLTPETPKIPGGLLSPNYHSSSSASPRILFTTSVSGSTIAGMIATKDYVSRPTQTDLTYKGLFTKKDEAETRRRRSDSLRPGSSTSDQQKEEESVFEASPILSRKNQIKEDSKEMITVVESVEPRETVSSFIARKVSDMARKTEEACKFKLKTPIRLEIEPITSPIIATSTTSNPFIPACLTAVAAEELNKNLVIRPDKMVAVPKWKNFVGSDTSSMEVTSSTSYDMTSSTTSLGSEWSQYSGLTATTEGDIECLVLSRSGEFLVTGSMEDVPMVWDTKTTSQLRSMRGKGMNAIDLHLTSDDSILCGGVPVDLMAEDSDVECGSEWSESVIRGKVKKLQIWDFSNGLPFDMPKGLSPYNVSHLLDSMDHPYQSHRLLMASFQREIGSVLFSVYDLPGNEFSFKRYAATPLKYQHNASIVRIIISGDAKYASVILVLYPEIQDVGKFYKKQKPEAQTSSLIINCYIDNLPFDSNQDHPDDESTVSFDAHYDATCALAGSHLALTVTWRQEAIVWNMATGSIVQRTDLRSELNKGDKGIMEMCCAVNSKYNDNLVLLASTDGWIGRLDVRDGYLEVEEIAHKQKITSLKFANNDQIFLSSSKDGTIKIWVTETLEPIACLEIGSPVLHFDTSDNGKVVSVLSREVVKAGWKGFLKRYKQVPKKRFLLFRANQIQ